MFEAFKIRRRRCYRRLFTMTCFSVLSLFPVTVFPALSLDIFWGKEQSYSYDQINLNNNIADQIKLRAEVDHVLEKKDSGSVKANHLSLGIYKNIVFKKPQSKILFALSQVKESNRIEIISADQWKTSLEQSQQKLQWAIASSIYRLNFHYYSTRYNYGFTLGNKPLDNFYVYYKQHTRFFSWNNSASIFTNDNTYLVDYSVNYSQQYRGGGLAYSGSLHLFQAEYLRSKTGDDEAGNLKGQWLVNTEYLFAYSYSHEKRDSLNDIITIDNNTNGIWLQKFQNQHLAISLTKKFRKNNFQAYLNHAKLAYKTTGAYNASLLADYWGSFFVGDGSFYADVKTISFTAGIKYGNKPDNLFANKRKNGFIWQFNTGLSRLSVSSDGWHRVAKVPIGLLINNKLNIKITRVDLMLVALGIGFRKKAWEVFYTMKQLIPIAVRDKTTNEVKTTSVDLASVNSIKSLPNGNRQYLYIKYYF